MGKTILGSLLLMLLFTVGACNVEPVTTTVTDTITKTTTAPVQTIISTVILEPSTVTKTVESTVTDSITTTVSITTDKTSTTETSTTSQEIITSPDGKLQVLSHSGAPSVGGYKYEVKGKIKNVSSSTVSAEITVKYYDENEAFLESVISIINDIPSNEIRSFTNLATVEYSWIDSYEIIVSTITP